MRSEPQEWRGGSGSRRRWACGACHQWWAPCDRSSRWMAWRSWLWSLLRGWSKTMTPDTEAKLCSHPFSQSMIPKRRKERGKLTRERERVRACFNYLLFIYSIFFYEIEYRTSEEGDSLSTGLQKTFGRDGEPGFLYIKLPVW